MAKQMRSVFIFKYRVAVSLDTYIPSNQKITHTENRYTGRWRTLYVCEHLVFDYLALAIYITVCSKDFWAGNEIATKSKPMA